MRENQKSSNKALEPTSKAERRKNFNPRAWARKWLKSDPLPQRVTIQENPEYWKDAIVCSICKGIYGGGELVNNKWVCLYCYEPEKKVSIPKEDLKNENNN